MKRPVQIVFAVFQFMRFHRIHVDRGFAFQLIQTADTFKIAATFAFPDRQRRAPVPFAGERPVDIMRQPVPETPFFDMLGIPVDRIIALDQLSLTAVVRMYQLCLA
jgi:hypothetical protein